MQKYVIVFPVRRDKFREILLVLKDRPAALAGRLHLVGGKVEPDEESGRAAVRELKEESGLDCIGLPVYEGRIFIPVTRRHAECSIDCYSCKVEDGQIVPRPGETETVSWFAWDEIKKDPRLMPNLHIIVPLIVSGSTSGWTVTEKHSSKNNHKVVLSLNFGGAE